MREAIRSGNAFGKPRAEREDERAGRQRGGRSGGLDVLQLRAVSIAERGMAHQNFAARLAERFGQHFACATRAHDARSRVVQRERDFRQIELTGTRCVDVIDFRSLKRNTQLLPEFLGAPVKTSGAERKMKSPVLKNRRIFIWRPHSASNVVQRSMARFAQVVQSSRVCRGLRTSCARRASRLRTWRASFPARRRRQA